jgi:uncharacterized membrane protein
VYLLLKAVHLFAVVIFLGNITTGLFWKAHADRTGDPRIIAHALDGIIRSDRWFTLPGAALIVVAGIATAEMGGWRIFRVGWIWWSIVLFTISGLIFGVAIVRLQRRMRDLARSVSTEKELREGGYRRLSIAWEIWGVLALLTPIAAFFLMVLKPDL